MYISTSQGKVGYFSTDETGDMKNAIMCLLFWALLCAVSAGTVPQDLEARSGVLLLADDHDGTLHLVNLSEPVQPYAASERDVTFYLYTRANTVTPTTIRIGVASSLGNFDARRRTELVIHGWLSNGNTMATVRNAYLRSGQDLNVIVVDWRRLAALTYPSSAAATRDVGALVGRLLDFLITRGLSPANINIVGFSLGAHVAGVAGQRCRSTVGRVTGLDPAGPLWLTVPRVNRLDKASGAHVQVIHTNGGGLGFTGVLGHIDFYPNGGSVQGGCGIDASGVCSHDRANQYYAESILGGRFTGRECASYQLFRNGMCVSRPTALMGYSVPLTSQGVFFLQTNYRSPFARG